MKVIEKNMFFGAKAELFSLALQMRKNPTEAERVMWKLLRKFRQSGFPFRRQHPIEFYIADFYCHNLRLVIEVDGEIHTEKEIQTHDEGSFPLSHRANLYTHLDCIRGGFSFYLFTPNPLKGA